MTSTRIAIVGVALLAAVAAPSRAQHRPPRWGGGGVASAASAASAASSRQQSVPRVAFQGPLLIVPGIPLTSTSRFVQVESRGGSWDGRRPDYGGSPPVQSRPQGADLSAFFGFVPPRGQTADNVPVPTALVMRQGRQRAEPEGAPKQQGLQHHPRIIWP